MSEHAVKMYKPTTDDDRICFIFIERNENRIRTWEYYVEKRIDFEFTDEFVTDKGETTI